MQRPPVPDWQTTEAQKGERTCPRSQKQLSSRTRTNSRGRPPSPPSSHQTLQFCKSTPPIFFPCQGLNMPLSLRPTNYLLKPGPGHPAAAGHSAVAHLGALNPELGGSKIPPQRQLLSMPGLTQVPSGCRPGHRAAHWVP